MFVLTKKMRKGDQKISWHGVIGVCAGVQGNDRTSGDVADLLNDLWHGVGVEVWEMH